MINFNDKLTSILEYNIDEARREHGRAGNTIEAIQEIYKTTRSFTRPIEMILAEIRRMSLYIRPDYIELFEEIINFINRYIHGQIEHDFDSLSSRYCNEIYVHIGDLRNHNVEHNTMGALYYTLIAVCYIDSAATIRQRSTSATDDGERRLLRNTAINSTTSAIQTLAKAYNCMVHANSYITRTGNRSFVNDNEGRNRRYINQLLSTLTRRDVSPSNRRHLESLRGYQPGEPDIVLRIANALDEIDIDTDESTPGDFVYQDGHGQIVFNLGHGNMLSAPDRSTLAELIAADENFLIPFLQLYGANEQIGESVQSNYELCEDINDEQRFISDLDNNPCDWNTRLIYADYLEENGRDGMANFQRFMVNNRIAPAYKHLLWVWHCQYQNGAARPHTSARASALGGDYASAMLDRYGVLSAVANGRLSLNFHSTLSVTHNGTVDYLSELGSFRFRYPTREDAEEALYEALISNNLIRAT